MERILNEITELLTVQDITLGFLRAEYLEVFGKSCQ